METLIFFAFEKSCLPLKLFEKVYLKLGGVKILFSLKIFLERYLSIARKDDKTPE